MTVSASDGTIKSLMGKVFVQNPSDDSVDRLSYFFTPMVLVIFSAVVAGKQYFGSTITCVVTPDLLIWQSYIENHCFISNTYKIEMFDIIEDEFDLYGEAASSNDILGYKKTSKRYIEQIQYYQWLPLFLLAQAFFFWAPNKLWVYFSYQNGTNINTLVQHCGQLESPENLVEVVFKVPNGKSCDEEEDETKKKMRANTNRYLMNVLSSIGVLHSTNMMSTTGHFWQRSSRISRSISTFGMLLTKCIYIFNILLQFYAMKNFLGTKSYFWPIDAFRLTFFSSPTPANKNKNFSIPYFWPEESNYYPNNDFAAFYGRQLTSENFPTQTMCDVNMSVLNPTYGKANRPPLVSTRCLLPMNLFNEKMFMLIWFWNVFLLVVCILNFIYWIGALLPCLQQKFVESLLDQSLYFRSFNDSVNNRITEQMAILKGDVAKFRKDVLGNDGYLFLRILYMQCGNFPAACICRHLFDAFRFGILQARQTMQKEVNRLREQEWSTYTADASLTCNRFVPPSGFYPSVDGARGSQHNDSPSTSHISSYGQTPPLTDDYFEMNMSMPPEEQKFYNPHIQPRSSTHNSSNPPQYTEQAAQFDQSVLPIKEDANGIEKVQLINNNISRNNARPHVIA